MSNPDYGSASYWDERYSADEEIYDWYLDFSNLLPVLSPYLSTSPDFEILIPGCGNSPLGANLYDMGCSNITNIDLSTVVINAMTDMFADREEMDFSVMDARKMEYIPDGCFDLIIDKALFDAILCSENNLDDASLYLTEVKRILKPNGCFFVVSHSTPERRLHILNQTFLANNQNNSSATFSIDYIKIVKPDIKNYNENDDSHHFFVYIVKKTE